MECVLIIVLKEIGITMEIVKLVVNHVHLAIPKDSVILVMVITLYIIVPVFFIAQKDTIPLIINVHYVTNPSIVKLVKIMILVNLVTKITFIIMDNVFTNVHQDISLKTEPVKLVLNHVKLVPTLKFVKVVFLHTSIIMEFVM